MNTLERSFIGKATVPHCAQQFLFFLSYTYFPVTDLKKKKEQLNNSMTSSFKVKLCGFMM